MRSLDPLKLLIVDDQEIIRESLEAKLQVLFVNAEITSVSTGGLAINLLADTEIDIVFMDISMPDLDGIAATLEILSRIPDQHVIAISMNDNDEVLNRMMAAGARGYLLKTDDNRDYKMAVNMVMNNQIFISPNIMIKEKKSR